MSTVSKEIADEVVKGNGIYGDDRPVVRIVQYTNMFTMKPESYGLEYENSRGKYRASPSVISPKVYWERK